MGVPLQIGIGLVPSIVGMATAAICEQIEAPRRRCLVVTSVLTCFAISEPLPVTLCPRPQSAPAPLYRATTTLGTTAGRGRSRPP